MRTGFVESLIQLAEQDERILLLTADLGWSVLEQFAQRFPRRFLNVGVAEQNMLGIATGLAQVGYVPFVYSIATFSSMRCYEQIRNGPILHHLPVRIIGIGGGYAYGHAGPTHHALEDLCIARAQPGLTVVAPADRQQAQTVMQATQNMPGPVYLRISKNACGNLPGLHGRFALDRPDIVHDGRDLLLLCTGEIAFEALRAAELLKRRGVSAAVAVMAHLPYSPCAALVELLQRFPSVSTVEEGYTAGGLASLAAETIAAHGIDCRLAVHGVNASCPPFSGSTKFMRAHFGLTGERLAEQVFGQLAPRSMAA